MGSGLQKAYSQQKNNKRKREEINEIDEKSQVVLHENIPQDLFDEILIRLPGKSLIRFKAVSKLWHSTISDPSFHRRRPAATSFFGISELHSLIHKFFTIDEKGSYKEFPIPACCKQYMHLYAESSNSCNGMLLLSLGPQIFLLNPSTHYMERLLTLDERYDNGVYRLGFCYDESIGDYKAVLSRRDFIMVASLKKKKWTKLRIPTGFYRLLPETILNGRLHARVHVGDSRFGLRNTIVYFNPTNEVFEKVPCPQPESGDEDAIVGLGVLEGCLCMARRIGENCYAPDVEVLKMKEYGVAESWTTLF